ncbi:MAG: ankyrin repeat domain-containing protein, partial [Coxiellaceae bacterium]|nr:ankyrin repeat domain-containing protein [Coxiellaceae bacterium]
MRSVDVMREIGLSDHDDGVCFGLAATTLISFLLGDEKFKKLQTKHSMIDSGVITDIKREKLSKYLTRVALFQAPYLYRNKFPDPKPFFQDIVSVSESKGGKRLKKAGGLKSVADISGVYSRDDFRDMLLSLSYAARRDPGSAAKRYAMLVANETHTVMVGYDSDNRLWFFHDHGVTASYDHDELRGAIKKLYDRLYCNDRDTLALTLNFYALGSQLDDAKHVIESWFQRSVMSEMHQIDEEKATFINQDGFAWIVFAAENGELDAVRKLLKYSLAAGDEGVRQVEIALWRASISGQLAVIDLIVDTAPSIINASGIHFPLHVAAQRGALSTVEKLL